MRSVLSSVSWDLVLNFRSTHLQLLRFHSFFLEQYPSSLVPVEYPTRLLRLSLGQLAPLLDTKAPLAPAAAQMNGGSSTSKRGKKRARGAEDGLVGGLEGRDRANLAKEEVDVIVESLRREYRPLWLNRHVLTCHSRASDPSNSDARTGAIDLLHSTPYITLPRSTNYLPPPQSPDRRIPSQGGSDVCTGKSRTHDGRRNGYESRMEDCDHVCSCESLCT
jgi:hypothetical protein